MSQGNHQSETTCAKGFKDPDVRDFMLENNYVSGKKRPARKLATLVLDKHPNAYKDMTTAVQGVYNFRKKLKSGAYNTILKQGKGTQQTELTLANKPTIKPKTQPINREIPITINGMIISVPGNKITINGQTIEW